jgi:hypothetical protein
MGMVVLTRSELIELERRVTRDDQTTMYDAMFYLPSSELPRTAESHSEPRHDDVPSIHNHSRSHKHNKVV